MMMPRLDTARRGRARGAFTLVELMIVIAIISIIAALAIPSLMNSRKVAVEAKCIAFLRSMVTINEQYRTRYGGYTDDPMNWITAGYFPDYANNTYLEEYSFNYNGSQYAWWTTMDPSDPGVSADRYFYVNVSGVIRWSSTATATSTSAPLE